MYNNAIAAFPSVFLSTSSKTGMLWPLKFTICASQYYHSTNQICTSLKINHIPDSLIVNLCRKLRKLFLNNSSKSQVANLVAYLGFQIIIAEASRYLLEDIDVEFESRCRYCPCSVIINLKGILAGNTGNQ